MEPLLKLAAVVGVAATPWGEVFFAIPVGIGLDLPAPLTFVAAVAGNAASVIVLVRPLGRWHSLRGFLLRG
ncbi:MAG: hypothetical protein HY535_02195 [Chloroflexi bacterium]|nr:hypothetical protein [Chloroflexota bacterium]